MRKISNYVIINGELYHAGVKGMRWGVRKYQNEDGTLTELGKKRYGKIPDGWSVKRQNEQNRTYHQWRNAKGSEKKELKKKLQQINKDGVKALNDYREFEGRRKYTKRDARDTVESAFIAGPKVRDKYGDSGYAVVKAKSMYDPNRKIKNAARNAGQAAAGTALLVLGNKAANSFYRSGKLDYQTAKLINAGSGFVGSALIGKSIGNTIGNLRTERYIKRYNKAVDKGN